MMADEMEGKLWIGRLIFPESKANREARFRIGIMYIEEWRRFEVSRDCYCRRKNFLNYTEVHGRGTAIHRVFFEPRSTPRARRNKGKRGKIWVLRSNFNICQPFRPGIFDIRVMRNRLPSTIFLFDRPFMALVKGKAEGLEYQRRTEPIWGTGRNCTNSHD